MSSFAKYANLLLQELPLPQALCSIACNLRCKCLVPLLLLPSPVAAMPFALQSTWSQTLCQQCRSIMFCSCPLLQCLISCTKPEQLKVTVPLKCSVYGEVFP